MHTKESLSASVTKELVPADSARLNEYFQWGEAKMEERKAQLIEVARKRKAEARR
jgi:hypothetical protein